VIFALLARTTDRTSVIRSLAYKHHRLRAVRNTAKAMSNHGGDNTKPSSPARSHHQVTRSIIEVSPPSFPKIHRPQHHHPHIHRRDKDDKTPQSAHLNLQQNGPADGAKSEAVTPHESHNGSRRTSMMGATSEIDRAGLPGNPREKRVVKEGQVKEEREKSVIIAT